MEKSLNQIYQSLQKLIGLHRQLLETVRMEREALKVADLKEIQETACAKEVLIQAIRQQEHERIKQTVELATMWKKPIKELTLTNIIIEVQGTDKKTAELLRSTYNALTILIQRITEQNEDNRQLIECSIGHIYSMKRNVLGEGSPRAETYTPHGQRTTNVAGARLISKEV